MRTGQNKRRRQATMRTGGARMLQRRQLQRKRRRRPRGGHAPLQGGRLNQTQWGNQAFTVLPEEQWGNQAFTVLPEEHTPLRSPKSSPLQLK